jgi:hypothetical protein
MTTFANTILQPTTAASNSNSFTMRQDMTAICVICTGLQGAETATLQFQNPIDLQWYDLLVNGIVPTFNSANNIINIAQYWGKFRAVKTATMSAVGVIVCGFYNYNQGNQL